jgi:hypothetical protein
MLYLWLGRFVNKAIIVGCHVGFKGYLDVSLDRTNIFDHTYIKANFHSRKIFSTSKFFSDGELVHFLQICGKFSRKFGALVHATHLQVIMTVFSPSQVGLSAIILACVVTSCGDS